MAAKKNITDEEQPKKGEGACLPGGRKKDIRKPIVDEEEDKE